MRRQSNDDARARHVLKAAFAPKPWRRGQQIDIGSEMCEHEASTICACCPAAVVYCRARLYDMKGHDMPLSFCPRLFGRRNIGVDEILVMAILILVSLTNLSHRERCSTAMSAAAMTGKASRARTPDYRHSRTADSAI